MSQPANEKSKDVTYAPESGTERDRIGDSAAGGRTKQSEPAKGSGKNPGQKDDVSSAPEEA